MDLPQPMARGRLVQRYKRFFADVAMDDGRAITAHCPNPGAMLGLNTPGLPVWLSRSDAVTRKLAYTLELVEADGGLVGINTLLPNRLVAEALAENRIPELSGYSSIRREVRYGQASRVDVVLEHPDRPPCWLEIKNVHLMRQPGVAEFPDCVAARSTRHLGELQAMAAQGQRAVALFVVQRQDCSGFKACFDLDPAFAKALHRSADAGLEVLIYACALTPSAVRVSHRIPWLRG